MQYSDPESMLVYGKMIQLLQFIHSNLFIFVSFGKYNIFADLYLVFFRKMPLSSSMCRILSQIKLKVSQ